MTLTKMVATTRRGSITPGNSTFRPHGPSLGRQEHGGFFGAYDGSFNVASKGTVYSLGASYDADWKRRFISDVKPYVSYSVFMRDTDGFKDSQRLLAATLEQGDLFDVQELSHKLTAASEMLGLVASGEGLDELLLRELDEVGECLHATHGAPAHGDHIVARGAALAS